jgi:hypothetical protein
MIYAPKYSRTRIKWERNYFFQRRCKIGLTIGQNRPHSALIDVIFCVEILAGIRMELL